ncbi:alpha/beta hydrolase family protein [Nitrospirillum amazonense]|uniref:alpha/beta hydrolase family protein n=1 Tax=Nitrospirillum amazonense TaxID=28077 RepID=UPI002412A067|nr:hypothetical protein [Nitrospirillum amazonense]MDG3439542.1 hypothetical protein [Nitrospirillum amazonense]
MAKLILKRMCPAIFLWATFLWAAVPAAEAAPVGLTYREVPLASAAARRSDHRPLLDVTIWYPAVEGTAQEEVDVGPPGQALLVGGPAAINAVPAAGAHPIVLLSPGFGGSAEDLFWLGGGLAARGFVVVGVSHPGNNALDRTPVGGTAWWERPRDLIAAVRAMATDPAVGPHLDLGHVGAAGFSMGGMTALALGGAVIDPGHFDDFCATRPADKVCDTAPETPDAPRVTQRYGIHLLGLDQAAARASDGAAFPGLRAILAIAPPVQMLSPESLGRVTAQTTLVVGDSDPLVPAATEAGVAARLVKDARLVMVPGAAHYSFVGICTPHGRTVLKLCAWAPEAERAHATALAEAIRLFQDTLSPGGRP